MAGDFLPSFPQKRVLPWALAGVSAAVLVAGFVTGNEPLLFLGVVGMAGVAVAYGLAALLPGSEHGEDRHPSDPGDHRDEGEQ